MPTTKTPAAGAACAWPGSPGAGGRMRWRSAIVSDALPMSHGAIFSNVPADVTSSSAAPTAPPATAAAASRRTLRDWPSSSVREPSVAPSELNTSATVFVTFACTGFSPVASSAGYETREARPVTLPARPAPRPAATRSRSSTVDTGATVWQRPRVDLARGPAPGCRSVRRAMTTPLNDRLGPIGAWMNVPATVPLRDLLGAARAVEELGYGALWYAETPLTREALVQASLLLAATQRIVIATGITSVYSRDAIALSAGAAALEEAHPGRFVLGMGVSHAPAVRTRGHDYGKPVATMRAYLDALDERGGDGPPRVLAALRRRMLELARDRSAGAH